MDWAALSELGGTVVVVALFLWFLGAQAKEHQKFMGNHMSKHTDALGAVAETLAQLVETTRNCPKKDG